MAEVMGNPQGGNVQQDYLLDMLFPGFKPIEGVGNIMGGMKDWMTRPPNMEMSQLIQNPESMGPMANTTFTGLPVTQGMMPNPQPGPSFEDQYNQMPPGDQAAVDYLQQQGDPGGSLGGLGMAMPQLDIPTTIDYVPPGGIQSDPKTSEPLPLIFPGGPAEDRPETPVSTEKQPVNIPTSQVLNMDQSKPIDLNSMFNLQDNTPPQDYTPSNKTNDLDYRSEVERINNIMPERLNDIQKRPADIWEGKSLGRLMLEGIVIRMAGYSPLEVWNSFNNKRQEQWKQDVDYTLKRLDVRREAEWKILNYKMDQQEKQRNTTLKKTELLINANPRLVENPQLWEDVGYGLGMSPEDAKQWAMENKDSSTGRFKLAITPEQRFLNQKLSEMKVLQMAYPEASPKDLAAAAFFQDSKGILADARTKITKQIEDLVMGGAPTDVIQAKREQLLSMENAISKSGIEETLDHVKMLNMIPGIKESLGEEEFNRMKAMIIGQAAGLKGYTPLTETSAEKTQRELVKAQMKGTNTFQHNVITTMNPLAGEDKDLYKSQVEKLNDMFEMEVKDGKLGKDFAAPKAAYIDATVKSMLSDGTTRGQTIAAVVTGARNMLLVKGIDLSLADIRLITDWYSSGASQVAVSQLIIDKILPKYGFKKEEIQQQSQGGPTQPQQSGQQPSPTAQGTSGTSKGYTQVAPLIDSAAKEHGVDPALVAAMIEVESNFNPTAVSRKRAMGLMQLMPDTARELGVTQPFNPEQNVKGGVRYIKQLLDKYKGDVNKALAAYNYGATNVANSLVLPLEVRAYVNDVLAARTKYLQQASTPGMI